jgi:putative heme transporter
VIVGDRELKPSQVLIGVIAAAVAAGAMFALVGRLAGFAKIRASLADADPKWLIVCVIGQITVFAGYAGAFRWTVRADEGPTVELGTSIRVVLASFAATQVFSFGGIGGLALMYWVLRRFERDAHAAAVRVIGLNTAVYLVFGMIAMVAAALALGLGDAPLGMTVPWLAGVPLAILAARWFTAPQRVAHWTAARPGLIHRALATGVGAVAWVRRRLGEPASRPLFVWAACYWVGDIASLWAALNAFGADPGLVGVTVAYTTGYLAQSLPIPLIATAGVDTATTLVLHTIGVPLELALLGVVAHRVFAFWIPLLPGTAFALTLSRLGIEPETP